MWSPPLLGIVVAVVLYLVGQRFVWTADLTGNQRYSLAPQSLQMLDGLGELLDGADARGRSGQRPGRAG